MEPNSNLSTKEKYMGTIYLAGGCFWGLQKFFDQFGGVVRTEVGYANGPDKAPSYQEVCRNSGHAETVRVDYNDEIMNLEELLDYYFMVIDPLSVNKQGNDIGIQYRTGIYYTDEGQLPAIRKVYERQQAEVGKPLAVAIEPIRTLRLLSSQSGISSLLRSTTRNIWIRIPEGTAIFRDLSFPSQANKKLVSQKL